MLRGDSAHMWQFNLLFSYYLTFKLRSTTLIQPTSPSLLMSETLSIGKLFEVWCVWEGNILLQVNSCTDGIT